MSNTEKVKKPRKSRAKVPSIYAAQDIASKSTAVSIPTQTDDEEPVTLTKRELRELLGGAREATPYVGTVQGPSGILAYAYASTNPATDNNTEAAFSQQAIMQQQMDSEREKQLLEAPVTHEPNVKKWWPFGRDPEGQGRKFK